MKTFTDTEGRLWNVKGTLGAFERVKTSTGVDMLDLPSTQKCLGQISDVFTLGKVLYAMCEQQCDARNISPEDFADGFNADVLVEASNALLEEVVFFCRKDLRPAMQMALDKARQADERMIAKMQGQAAAMEQQMDRAMESMLTSTDSATSSLESSASIPANGHSAGSSGRRTAGRKKHGAARAH